MALSDLRDTLINVEFDFKLLEFTVPLVIPLFRRRTAGRTAHLQQPYFYRCIVTVDIGLNYPAVGLSDRV